jgi:hypothetical protein
MRHKYRVILSDVEGTPFEYEYSNQRKPDRIDDNGNNLSIQEAMIESSIQFARANGFNKDALKLFPPISAERIEDAI